MSDKFYSPLLETMAQKFSKEDFCYILNRFKESSDVDISLMKYVSTCYFFLLAESNLLEEFGSLSPELIFETFNENQRHKKRFMRNVVFQNLAECGYNSMASMSQDRLLTLIFIKSFLREREYGALLACPY